jgi:Fe2+ or Zn2+ uptake regulation protein
MCIANRRKYFIIRIRIILNRSGRMTKQRRLVYDIVRSTGEHPDAERVYRAAKERLPSIAMATVYNNLNALTEQGLLRRVRIPGRPDCYDRTTAPHDHLLCDGCGVLRDADFGGLLKELRRRSGLEIVSYDLTAHYLCPACAGQADPAENPGGAPH